MFCGTRQQSVQEEEGQMEGCSTVVIEPRQTHKQRDECRYMESCIYQCHTGSNEFRVIGHILYTRPCVSWNIRMANLNLARWGGLEASGAAREL